MFEIKCTADTDFDWETNVTAAECVDSVCHFSPAETFNPGTKLSCSIRALVSLRGWTDEEEDMLIVLERIRYNSHQAICLP